MTRRGRRILGFCITAIVALAIGIGIGYVLVLPWLIKREVTSVLHAAGLSNVSFRLESGSLHATNLSNLSAGKNGLLKIGAVAIRYSPLDAARGELRSITIRDARLQVDLDHPPAGLFKEQPHPTTAQVGQSRCHLTSLS